MIVLLIGSAHLTLASLFNEMPKLKLWLIEEYGKLANGWYGCYLETRDDRTQSPKKIAKIREVTIWYLLEFDEILRMQAALTRKRNLFLGSWVTYLTLCVMTRLSQRKVASALRKYQNDRVRRENMRV